MLEIDRLQPEDLDRPVLVAAFSGWVDGGYCGQGAVRYLMANASGAREVARVDLSSTVDLNANRPQIRVVDGVVGSLEWPGLEIVVAHPGRDIVVMAGPEPSLQWKPLVDSLRGLAQRWSISEAYFLGGMPAAVTHDSPVAVLATVGDAALGARLAPLRPDYRGPTGLQTALQHELAAAGIPAAGLWAQVPPYVASTPSPPAIRALLERLSTAVGLEIDLNPFEDQIHRWRERVAMQLREHPELAELVDRLREVMGEDDTEPAPRQDPGLADMGLDQVPSGEELAREIERYLREQP